MTTIYRDIKIPFIVIGLLSGTALGAQNARQVPYNIILITPDQLRADSLHTYGYPYADSPNIDRLASEGTVFLHAYSAGSWTTPSFGSILTGLFPTVHGMTLPPYERCGPEILQPLTDGKIPSIPSDLLLSPHKSILPELLKAAGVETAADNANCWSILDVRTRSWDSFKFFPGAQLPVPGHPDKNSDYYLTAPQTTEWAENWLKAHKDNRFFLWVHYFEPHAPYNAPPEYDIFKTKDDPLSIDGLYNLARLGDAQAILRLNELYAAKILYVDHYVGQLMSTIRALGLKQNTIVIFASDHGQLIFSHPENFNMDDHRSLFDTVQHVPLIFWGSGIPAGQRKKALAGHYDLLPTILSLEGLPLPKLQDGTSLSPVLTGKQSQVHQYVYGEETIVIPQYSIRDQRHKLIETMPTGGIQCYDLTIDPGEKKNICRQLPRKAAELKTALDQHIAQMIQEAHSFPDWRFNQALAVLEQRDTPQIAELAPKDLLAQGGSNFQLTRGSLWELLPDGEYWAQPGDGSARASWRSDEPMIGDYEVSVQWKRPAIANQKLASNSNFTVRFKGGSRSFVVDLNNPPENWKVLGEFHDPISVTLTNRADGPIIADTVRFQHLGAIPVQ